MRSLFMLIGALAALCLAACSSNNAGAHHVWSLANPGAQPGTDAPGPLDLRLCRRESESGGDALVAYESPAASPGEFDECLLSWNVQTPPGTGVWFEVRVRARRGPWSPWLFIGDWGDLPARGPLVTRWPDGDVAIDVLEGRRAFDQVQCRVTAAFGPESAAQPGACVTVRHLSVVTTLTSTLKRHPPRATPMTGGPVRLEVPFLSQKTDRPELAGRLCSPTSVAMVLAYRGAPTPVGDVAALAFDPRHDIYGVWPRNVQAAFTRGVPGEVRRFGSWDEAERVIRSGTPIIASIRAEEGELPGAPYSSTDGHLIVLKGFDAAGDVIVNDPAASDAAHGERVYSRAALTRVWMVRGKGTAYVLGARDAAMP